MPALVTLAECKRAARITHTDEDEELLRLMDEAQTLVLDAIKNRAEDADTWEATVDAWDDETALTDIKGAIIRQFVATERFRGGDDPKMEPVWVHGLDPRAWAIVQKYRDPSLA
jgi:hypothetical protein